ncbi:hypothetical protein ACIRYZ_18715 [Kitasatospora sp. NPDC101155]|uniref:hypothetical protein n=1 Tax=Kitasatospora sp. NPDC101155 TaxID=3364097 RepID=UPI003817A6E9
MTGLGLNAALQLNTPPVFPKKDSPDAQAYGGSGTRAELRLITCGGKFDRHAGYESDTVAFAHLSAVR